MAFLVSSEMGIADAFLSTPAMMFSRCRRVAIESCAQADESR
jgi:hypothetical protein